MIKVFRDELKKISVNDFDVAPEQIARSKAICVYFATYFRMDERAKNAIVQNIFKDESTSQAPTSPTLFHQCKHDGAEVYDGVDVARWH